MNHLAVIMDGNRRWARQQGKYPSYGHKAGVEAVGRVVEYCLKNKIPYLSLYTFSLENFNRSPKEYTYLFELLAQAINQEADRANKEKICVRFIGDRSLFPSSLLPAIEKIERETAQFSRLRVNILFCYGGQQEIIDGVRSVVQSIKAGTMSEQDLTVDTFRKHLWLDDCPSPDLVVRTGGAHRLSNFLLFHAAYSELFFLDCMWPDIGEKQLQDASDYFANCQRRFGQ